MNLAGIENLNDRIHQNIYEAGKNFSGGQKTKNYNCKRTFREPEILIFDEPTSSLDKYSTKIIEKTIKKYKGKKQS